MIYQYECAAAHVTELDFKMGTAPRTLVECPYIPEKFSAGDYPLYTKSCGLPSPVLLITGGNGFIINKEMLPPSKRYKGFTGGD